MDHSGHDMEGGGSSGMASGRAGHGSNRPVAHAKSEFGPQVDLRADGARAA